MEVCDKQASCWLWHRHWLADYRYEWIVRTAHLCWGRHDSSFMYRDIMVFRCFAVRIDSRVFVFLAVTITVRKLAMWAEMTAKPSSVVDAFYWPQSSSRVAVQWDHVSQVVSAIFGVVSIVADTGCWVLLTSTSDAHRRRCMHMPLCVALLAACLWHFSPFQLTLKPTIQDFCCKL